MAEKRQLGRGGATDRPLGLGFQPLGKLQVAQVASQGDAWTRRGLWRQADEV